MLAQNAAMPPRRRAEQAFGALRGALARYPMLAQIDADAVALVALKAPQARLDEFARQGVCAARLLEAHHIPLRCSPEVADAVFQALYAGWLRLQNALPDTRERACDMLLRGAIAQIVEDA